MNLNTIKQQERLFNKAVKKFKEEYEKALKLDYIQKPLSYSLYRTWRYFDSLENAEDRSANNEKL